MSTNKIQEQQEIYIKAVFKHNKQISFTILKREKNSLSEDIVTSLDYEYYHQTREQDFRIGELRSHLYKRSYCVSDLNEALKKMENENWFSKDIKIDQNFVCQKIKFFFNNKIFTKKSKNNAKRMINDFLINHITMKKCSNQFISEVFNSFEIKNLKFVCLEDCPIGDQNLQDILKKIDYLPNINEEINSNSQQQSEINKQKFMNVEIQIKKCQYFSPNALDFLKEWQNNMLINEQNAYAGNGFSLIGSSFLRPITLIQFAASKFFK